MSLLCFDSRVSDSSRSLSSLQPLLLQRLTRLLPLRHQRRLQPRSQRTCNRLAWDLQDDRPATYMTWAGKDDAFALPPLAAALAKACADSAC